MCELIAIAALIIIAIEALVIIRLDDQLDDYKHGVRK